MTLIKRNPALNFPSIFEEFLKPDFFGGMQNFTGNVPAVNILENDTNFMVELAAPGLKKEDFVVEVDQQVLTISAEVKNEVNETSENGKYSRREFSYQSFKRSFNLPETVNEEQIAASYENGVLKVMLPKKEEVLPKPKKLISIEG